MPRGRPDAWRANFTACSLASAPPSVKKTRPPSKPDFSSSSSARAARGSAPHAAVDEAQPLGLLPDRAQPAPGAGGRGSCTRPGCSCRGRTGRRRPRSGHRGRRRRSGHPSPPARTRSAGRCRARGSLRTHYRSSTLPCQRTRRPPVFVARGFRPAAGPRERPDETCVSLCGGENPVRPSRWGVGPHPYRRPCGDADRGADGSPAGCGLGGRGRRAARLREPGGRRQSERGPDGRAAGGPACGGPRRDRQPPVCLGARGRRAGRAGDPLRRRGPRRRGRGGEHVAGAARHRQGGFGILEEPAPRGHDRRVALRESADAGALRHGQQSGDRREPGARTRNLEGGPGRVHALRSQQRAEAARQAGILAHEIVPVDGGDGGRGTGDKRRGGWT